MDVINIGLITLTVISSSPGLGQDYGQAADYARRALLETETVKQTAKRIEHKAENILENNIGLDKKDLVYFVWALPVASGRISTKPFKNLKAKVLGGTLRPEVQYQFTKDEFSGKVIYLYDF